jgi:hypothetical protein
MKKTRTENLPPLHPNTLAALAGAWRVEIADDGTVAATVEPLQGQQSFNAAYQARNVHPRLVKLVASIRGCRGVDALRDLYQESLAKLEQVTGIAVAVDDDAFPEHLAFAMKYVRDPATPRRQAVFRAWKYLTSGCTMHDQKTGITKTFTNPSIEEIHALAEDIHGETIAPRTLDDDLEEMRLTGFKKRPRGRPGKSG